MSSWTQDELKTVGEADEMTIAPAQGDGTLLRATLIWVVRVGDQLFVRSYRRRHGRWYQSAQRTHQGRISAGGLMKDVALVGVGDDDSINAAIDAAYEAKYQRYGARYVEPMVASDARAATVLLLPAEQNE